MKPEERWGSMLCNSGFEITAGRLEKCLLPAQIFGTDGAAIASRPRHGVAVEPRFD
jgi:hypothetical protein